MWDIIVNIASVSAGFILGFSYIPQVWKFYRTKNVEGVSLSFWLILDLSLTMLFILAIDNYLATGALGLISAQGLNLGLALVVTGQVLYYGREAKKVTIGKGTGIEFSNKEANIKEETN